MDGHIDRTDWNAEARRGGLVVDEHVVQFEITNRDALEKAVRGELRRGTIHKHPDDGRLLEDVGEIVDVIINTKKLLVTPNVEAKEVEGT